jgi:hypothetical protein
VYRNVLFNRNVSRNIDTNRQHNIGRTNQNETLRVEYVPLIGYAYEQSNIEQ